MVALMYDAGALYGTSLHIASARLTQRLFGDLNQQLCSCLLSCAIANPSALRTTIIAMFLWVSVASQVCKHQSNGNARGSAR